MTSDELTIEKRSWWRRLGGEITCSEHRVFLVGALCICGFAMLFPGDVPFVSDEPWTIREALTHNQEGRIATEGMTGSLGVKYGPVPFWFYQVMLLMTHNLIIISLVKNFLHLAIFTYALLYLGKELKLTRAFGLIALCSPYLLYVNRLLWLFGFIGPLSGCLALWMLRFIRTGKYRYFLYSVITTIAFTYTHPLSVFIIIPFYGTVFAFGYKHLLTKKLLYASTLMIALAAVLPFLIGVLSSLGGGGASGPKGSVMLAFLTAINGSLYFSFMGWANHHIPEFYQSSNLPLGVLVGMTYATGIAWILYLVGLLRCITVFIGNFNKKELGARDALTVFSLFSILFASGFFVVTRMLFLQHYFVPLWLPFFFFIWAALQWIWESKPRLITIMVPIWACHVILMVLTMLYIHRNGGSRSVLYGATLANQMKVAAKLKRESSESVIYTNVKNYQIYPHALDALMRLSDVVPSADSEPSVLHINYVEPRSNSGWIDVWRDDSPK